MVGQFLLWIMNGIDFIGVGIICYGIVRACWIFIQYCFLGANVSIDDIRLNLGRAIVLAVEFLLAADIIKTIVTPDYYEIGMLGALVIIRTVLTYFLNKELEQLQNKSI
jgi:uncharacterized membrane protein